MEDERHGGNASPEVWAGRMEAVRAALAAVPGVKGATFGVTMPLEFTGGGTCCFRTGIHAAGVEAVPRAVIHPVDANYFKLLELRFIAGTDWDRTDLARPFPAVISEPVAIALFGSAANAIGREITIPFQEEARARVTGVVAPDRHYGPATEPKDGVYLPSHGTPVAIGRAHFAVLIDSRDEGLANRLREAVWRAEPDLPVPIVRPLEEWAGAATARARFQSLLFTTFASVALLLVAGGLYGTLLYSVGQRRREMGIRLALGDAPARLELRVLSQGVLTTVLGGAIGLAGVWGLGRLLRTWLFENEANDPVTMAGALGVLLVVTVLASWLPARRAASTDPMEALRTD
jgi:hypothetical protein